MGLISRVSSRTYRFLFEMAKKLTRKQHRNRMKHIHPNSRQAEHLNKQQELRKRRDVQTHLRDRKYEALKQKFLWFKEHAPEKPTTHGELGELTQIFVTRFQ